MVLILGYLELKSGWIFGVQDAVWGIPELALLATIALRFNIQIDKSQARNGQRTLGLLIDNINPMFFMLAITFMVVEIAADHPWVGFVCISAAVAIYGTRATILQVSMSDRKRS